MISYSSSDNFCSAINCSNSQTNRPGLSFFRFPNDKERSLQWVQNICRYDLLNRSLFYLNNRYICAEHFEDDQFSNQVTKNRLKWNAVPTLVNTADSSLETLSSFHKAVKRKGADNPIQCTLKQRTESPLPLIDHSYCKLPNTNDSSCDNPKEPASQTEEKLFKKEQLQTFQINKEANHLKLLINQAVNHLQTVHEPHISHSNTNSHLADPHKDSNTPSLHIVPSQKLLETPFDRNKQRDSGFLSPVQIKQEPCEEETPLTHPCIPNLIPTDDHFFTIKSDITASIGDTNQVPSSGPLSSEFFTDYSESEFSQKDFSTNSTNLEENSIKIQNVVSVPINLPINVAEDDRHVTISRNCLKMLMSLVSCPICQAEVNHQETVQGFKAGTLVSLNLLCYNGHSLQPRW